MRTRCRPLTIASSRSRGRTVCSAISRRATTGFLSRSRSIVRSAPPEIWRARCAANRTRSNLFETLSTQSSTVTRAISRLAKPFQNRNMGCQEGRANSPRALGKSMKSGLTCDRSGGGGAVVHQHAREIDHLQRIGARDLLQVRACRVAAFRILIIIEGEAHLLHARGELARVAGADAVVLGRGEDEGNGIGCALAQVLIGRELVPEGADARVLDAAILALPRRAGGNLRNADHVEQRNVDDHRLPQLGMLGELDPHQQPAVGTPADAEAARGGHAAGDEVARHAREIVVDDLPLGPEPGLVPGGPELAAAADVGERIDPALLEPQLAGRLAIARR